VRGRIFTIVGVAAMLGCSGTSVRKEGPSRTATLATGTTQEGLIVRQSDLDGDGKPDLLSYYREEPGLEGTKQQVLVRKTMDVNQDGKMDMTQEYDARGRLAREELDMDFDGRPDAVRFYENGQLVREEISSRFDARFDVRKFYENGALVLKTVDTSRTGRFDEYQYFVGNQLTRIGWDRDGDGKPEVFEDNPAAAPDAGPR